MPLKRFTDAETMVEALKPGYPVYCLRPAELRRTAEAFLETFPGRVLYAVKCNPHLAVLKTFYEAGIRHFDTASLSEVALISENFQDANCYFMHPVKARSAILSAHKVYGVDHYVIDHEAELRKISDVVGGGGDGQTVLVRVVTPQHDAMYKLSEKFGAGPADAVDLLRKVDAEGFQAGIAFHVGSQCRMPEAFKDAVWIVGEVARESGVHVHYLDVGGGFPVPYVEDKVPELTAYFDAIQEAVAKTRLRRDCVLMCEPGRAMVASGMSLVVQVQLRKADAVYVNDGIYHSLSEAVTGNVRYPMRLVRPNGSASDETAEFAFFGPTCDSTDLLPYRVSLPADIGEGDWIEIGQVGAYSNAMTTRFNGFFPETFVELEDPPLLPR